MEKICGIYKIISPSKRIYIGQSVDIYGRWNVYKNYPCKKQPLIYRSIKKYGWDKHKFEIIHRCEREELNDLEKYYVDLYQSFNSKCGMNSKDGGGAQGKASEETRKKMSIAHTGLKNIMYGKTHTEQAKNKISETHKGRVLTDEHRLKISLNSSRHNLGKKMSDEQKENHSKIMKGRIMSEENKSKIKLTITLMKGKIVLNTETGIFYLSCNEAAYFNNIHKVTLSNYLLNNRKNKTSLIFA